MSNSLYTPDVGKTQYATAAIATFTAWIGSSLLKAILYTANSAGMPYQTTYGTLTQPTFTGYAAIDLANPTLGSLIADDQQPVQFDAITFQPSAGTGLPQTALGWAVYYATGNVLLNYQPFTSSFVFSSTSSACTFTPVISWGQISIP